ncbi:unnamed protein product, partial [Pocillopora meandrina]
FLRNCQKPVTTNTTPDEREPATGSAVIPTFRTLGHIFAKPKEPVTKE